MRRGWVDMLITPGSIFHGTQQPSDIRWPGSDGWKIPMCGRCDRRISSAGPDELATGHPQGLPQRASVGPPGLATVGTPAPEGIPLMRYRWEHTDARTGSGRVEAEGYTGPSRTRACGSSVYQPATGKTPAVDIRCEMHRYSQAAERPFPGSPGRSLASMSTEKLHSALGHRPTR